jgi:hypothetical protein
VEEGDRGPKAMEVRIGGASEDDGMSDVLSVTEFHGEIDDIIDTAIRDMKARVKQELVEAVKGHGWVDG